MKTINRLAITSTLTLASFLALANCQNYEYTPMQKDCAGGDLRFNGQYTATFADVEDCKAMCSTMDNCGGFSANIQQGRCAFKMTQDNWPQMQDCVAQNGTIENGYIFYKKVLPSEEVATEEQGSNCQTFDLDDLKTNYAGCPCVTYLTQEYLNALNTNCSEYTYSIRNGYQDCNGVLQELIGGPRSTGSEQIFGVEKIGGKFPRAQCWPNAISGPQSGSFASINTQDELNACRDFVRKLATGLNIDIQGSSEGFSDCR